MTSVLSFFSQEDKNGRRNWFNFIISNLSLMGQVYLLEYITYPILDGLRSWRIVVGFLISCISYSTQDSRQFLIFSHAIIETGGLYYEEECIRKEDLEGSRQAD